MADYHQFVFNDGQFVGRFDDMYRAVDDPWGHGDATSLKYELVLAVLRKAALTADNDIVDIGSGKGAFTSRVRGSIACRQVLGLDISPTAIGFARERYGAPGLAFEVCDVTDFPALAKLLPPSPSLVLLSDILWYILPRFADLLRFLRDAGTQRIVVNQTFYRGDEQRYGKELVSSVDQMIALVPFVLRDAVHAELQAESPRSICLFSAS